MSKKERWLTMIAFVASVIPLLFMAFTLKLLPVKLPIVDLNIDVDTPEFISKYNNLIMGLFCIVPLSIVVIARHLKRRMVYYRNYSAILLVSIALSLSFTGISLYGFLNQINTVSLEDFDVFGLTSVLLSLGIAVMGPFIRYRRFGSKLAFNNRHTRISTSVWKVVHANCGSIQTIVFVMLAAILSFLEGYKTLIILVGAFILYMGWVLYYSFVVKTAFERKSAQKNL